MMCDVPITWRTLQSVSWHRTIARRSSVASTSCAVRVAANALNIAHDTCATRGTTLLASPTQRSSMIRLRVARAAKETGGVLKC